MLGDLHEASSNENKVLRQEIEALRADKIVKDEQLNMLYTVMEHKLGINVQAVYNELEIQRVEERRVAREKELAKEAAQKKKGLVVDTQEVAGSSSHPEGDDVEMTEAEVNEEHTEVDPEQGFVLMGESVSRPCNLNDVNRMVKVEQRKGKVRAADVKLLCYKEEKEEEEEEKFDDEELDQLFEDTDKCPENEDDDDQGATGLLIVKPSVQQSLDDFLNDELNEQVDDQHQESSSSGKQHADQVFLTQPKVIYLHYAFEGELEVPRTREEMLEELGMDDGNLKFDIEDEIPSSPEREYEFKLANEADNFNHVEVEEGSDISEEDTPYRYSGVDDTFPTFAEMFKSQNEDELRRKVVEKISTEGIPETVPQETLLEGRKNWFKVMPKERKYKRPLQYFTDHPEKSLGDILSWGYLEDLKVYAIRREQWCQYFEFLSNIKTLPWWDVEELVQTKNIKQFYYDLDVKIHDQKLWDYIKLQANNRFPDWKPQFPK
ncbi:hypothetical protein HanRHA438_Chr11g0495851 [Helianthus annuus]|nr:hypothetical protein HanIR_Chr11g0519811 [Helianthus annuus]KAJ0870044.1 hypothetical protein HanRHA438_Chr11g0495851 [Helianthus annuus]